MCVAEKGEFGPAQCTLEGFWKMRSTSGSWNKQPAHRNELLAKESSARQHQPKLVQEGELKNERVSAEFFHLLEESLASCSKAGWNVFLPLWRSNFALLCVFKDIGFTASDFFTVTQGKILSLGSEPVEQFPDLGAWNE